MRHLKQFLCLMLVSVVTFAMMGVCAPMSASAETVPMTWKPMDKGYVIIEMDDASEELETFYKLIVEQYGFPMCCSTWSIDLGTNVEKTARLRWLEDHGGEITSHTHNNLGVYGNTPLETIEADFKASAEAFKAHGFNVNGIMVQGKGGSELDHYSDAARARVEPITSKYFYYSDRYGMSTQYNNPRKWLAAGWSQTKPLIDSAISNKSFTILATHGYDEVPGMATYKHEYLIQLLDYIKQKEQEGVLEVITYRDLFKRFANWSQPVDLGDTKYTVDFYAEDGKTLIGSSVVIEGKAATAPTFDLASGYVFKGWSENVSKVTGNMKVKAVTQYTGSGSGGSSGIIAHTHKWSEYKSDKTGHWRVCTNKACGEQEKASAHKPGAAATEKAAQTCTVCGYELAPKLVHEHRFDNKWITDANGHWHTCKTCGGKSTVEKHTAGPAATQSKDQTCTVCGYIITPALGHVHRLTKIEAKPATAEQDGNIEYYSCSCGKWFADADGKTEIKSRDDLIVKAGDTPDTPDASEPQAPDASAPDTSVPADTSAADAADDKPIGALPFIILGACAAVAAAAVAGVLIWSKKKNPPKK